MLVVVEDRLTCWMILQICKIKLCTVQYSGCIENTCLNGVDGKIWKKAQSSLFGKRLVECTKGFMEITEIGMLGFDSESEKRDRSVSKNGTTSFDLAWFTFKMPGLKCGEVYSTIFNDSSSSSSISSSSSSTSSISSSSLAMELVLVKLMAPLAANLFWRFSNN